MPVIIMQHGKSTHTLRVREQGIYDSLRLLKPDSFRILMDDRKKYISNEQKAFLLERFTRREQTCDSQTEGEGAIPYNCP